MLAALAWLLHTGAVQAGEPQDADPWVDLPDRELVARTIASEATGEARQVKAGLAWTIRNRVDRRGGSYYQVIVASGEFMAFSLPSDTWPARVLREPQALLGQREWQEDLDIAAAVLAGREPNPIGTATHYCTNRPAWAREEWRTATLGPFKFYDVWGGELADTNYSSSDRSYTTARALIVNNTTKLGDDDIAGLLASTDTEGILADLVRTMLADLERDADTESDRYWLCRSNRPFHSCLQVGGCEICTLAERRLGTEDQGEP